MRTDAHHVQAGETREAVEPATAHGRRVAGNARPEDGTNRRYILRVFCDNDVLILLFIEYKMGATGLYAFNVLSNE